jgi:putative ABC transport system permease protein
MDRILTASLPIPEERYNTPEKRIEFYHKIEERLATLPGVERAAIATATPIFGYHSDRQIFADPALAGHPENPAAFHVMISPDYFAALGIPLREGATFAPDLKNDGPQHVIVSESLARHFWPTDSAIGKRLGIVVDKETLWREIVGVAADVDSVANITNPATSFTVYKPFAQEPWSYANLIVRSAHPAALTDTLRRAVAEMAPDLPIDEIGTVRQIAGRSQHNLIVISRLLIGFAGLGVLLAAVGLYGVISHVVAQRTSEFGIRIALGAQSRDILHLVLSLGLWLTTIGLILGLAGSWALGRFLASFMPRVVTADPLGQAAVSILLLVVTLVACWLPARRATKIDPLVALRAE